MRKKKILICDDDSLFHIHLKHSLLKDQFELISALNGDEAVAIVKSHSIDILLLDIQMRSRDEGFHFIPKFLEIDPHLAIVVTSSLVDFIAVREAIQLGAADYIVKDLDLPLLIHTLNQVLERRSSFNPHQPNHFDTLSIHKQNILIGESAQIQELKKNIEKIRRSHANVIITGETGTGKELVARQLRTPLPNGTLAPFLSIDSSTIQSSIAESILFGHEKGAFTGADKLVKGLFEEADNGIVYFDEVSNMPLDIQAKLLRVLQEREVTRIGSSKVLKLNFRVICATNQNLECMVQAGKFKNDLLQRLNVIPISLPPLRERQNDIPLLISQFILKQPTPFGSLKFTERAIEFLKTYSWPGNVRELANTITYLATMIEGSEVDISDLPAKFLKIEKETDYINITKEIPHSQESFYSRISNFEKTLLSQEYLRFDGNIMQLAASLKMDRSHLYTKLKKFGIHKTSSSLN